MIAFLMIWLYFGLLFTVMQWPAKIAMITSFVFLVGPPLLLLYRVLASKRNQRRTPGATAGSVQVGMREENDQDPEKD